MTETFTTGELMAVTLARGLRNGEWGACGANSQIPMAAFQLARLMHAPDLNWLSGGGGAINSTARLVKSTADPVTLDSAEHAFRLEDIVDFELGGWRKAPTVGIFGGMQVDRRGNVNMVGIGRDYPTLQVRGPGTVGLVFAAYFSRTMIFLQRHDRRILVEEADYVSAPGRTAARREFCDPHSDGPQLVVTPLAVLDFGDDDTLRLKSVHPGRTADEVRERTGFDLPSSNSAEVPFTPAPTGEELTVLRERVDPSGVLRRLRLD
ncbi:3-oxoadipate--succinyl-CoA transferase subunit B [Kineosporiaceae bacterium SCSIO 59966]|nr:3-oxoadipate--succinyl-CoA transferase subunit B [Kineosporiaceae bacterium SCSIO 59966]